MTGKYKALGLALMALAAFGAIAAQGASANPLTVPNVPVGQQVHITGTTDTGSSHILNVGGGLSISCTHAEYDGTAVVGAGNTVNHITLAPTYTTNTCTGFGFPNHVNMNGCTYTLTTGVKLPDGTTTISAPLGQIHIVCPAGKKIEITPTTFGVSACTVSIGEQTPTGGHIVIRNSGGAGNTMDITDEITLAGIAFTSTGGACGASGNNAGFTGNTTAKCYSDVAHTVQTSCTFS